MKIKTLILTIVALFAGLTLNAVSEKNVPAPVKAIIAKEYPKATSIDWDFEDDDGYYEAEFKIGELDYEVHVSPTGELLKRKEQIMVKDIPAAISSYIKDHHPEHTVRKAKKITRHMTVKKDGKDVKEKVITYKVDVRKGMLPLGDKELVFTEKGELIEVDD